MSKNISPTIDRAKVYMVLGLSVDDATQLDNYYDNENQAFEKLYESLDDTEREELAQYIGEWMYDQDQWQEALRAGLTIIASDKVNEASK